MTAKDLPDFDELADYAILGELAGHGGDRVLLATRRADERPVLLTIVRQPEDDEGNSLSHLAADTNQLVGASHPNVVPVIAGHWVGPERFAVVTARVPAPTLEEVLARRDEAFPYERVAAILRDVNAALEWARGRNVVHRQLRLDTVYVEPGDQVRVRFVPSALPATGMPGSGADARTIATFARAMLTRSVFAPEREQQPLSELRPGLPDRVVQQTDALLAATDDAPPPDVRGFIAAIAMAEELKRGEVERAEMSRSMMEEQRALREALAAERAAHDAELAEQGRRFAEERERARRALAEEREKGARALARERAAIERERRQLARMREALDREVRRPLADRQVELTPVLDHALDAPPEPWDEILDEPDDTPPPGALEGAASGAHAERQRRSPGQRWWSRAAIALPALLIVLGASAVALARRGAPRPRAAPAPTVDSAAGGLAPALPPVVVGSPRPESTANTGAGQAARSPGPGRGRARTLKTRLPVRMDTSRARPPAGDMAPALIGGDSAARLPAFARSDSSVVRDSIRRDSVARAIQDSLRRVMRRMDSLLPPRDTTPGRVER